MVTIGLLLSWLTTNAQSPDEYQVKAVFLYNFTHFINWPNHSYSSSDAPFVIGVMGRNVFGKSLEETISGEQVASHAIIVKEIETVEQAKACHILFIERSFKNLEEAAKELKHLPTLTVSDDEQFMQKGGKIRLYKDRNKIRLEINTNAMDQSALQISSKLLSLSTIYRK